MTDLLPQNVFPKNLGFSEDQLHDACYVAHRSATALGRRGIVPKIAETRYDLDNPHGRTVIRVVFVVQEKDYRGRYMPRGAPKASKKRRPFCSFEEDRAELEQVVKDTLETLRIACDTLYVGVAMGHK